MKTLRRLVILCVAAGLAAGARADVRPSQAEPALYSFSDLYRLTVSGNAPEPIGAAPMNVEPHQLRVASVNAAPAVPDVRFTITPVPGPGRWMLLLAGLAAATWVAHRRLTRPL